MSGHSISGRVMLANGTGMAGVTVTRTGAGTAPVTTNSAGYYTFINVPDGSVTVTPGLNGYIFTPSNKVITMAGADVLNQNFIAATGYTIIGRIATSSGAAIAGADVQLDGGAIVKTNSAGYFTFADVANGQHTLVPSKSGYSFTPMQKTVTVNNANLSGQNFTGSGP
jgi:inhibitor of cysteine peptidase